MSEAFDRTIGQKARMFLCVDESGRCNASDRPDRLSGSSQHMLRSTTLQHLSPSDHVCNEAPAPHRGLRDMANRGGRCWLTRHTSGIGPTEPNNVTNPSQS